MCITYSILSCNLVTSFSNFQSSSSQVKMINHYKVHAIFQDMNINFKKISFIKILMKLRGIFDPLKIIYRKLLPNHIIYLHVNIEDMTILHFCHNLSCIFDHLLYIEKYSDILILLCSFLKLLAMLILVQ